MSHDKGATRRRSESNEQVGGEQSLDQPGRRLDVGRVGMPAGQRSYAPRRHVHAMQAARPGSKPRTSLIGAVGCPAPGTPPAPIRISKPRSPSASSSCEDGGEPPCMLWASDLSSSHTFLLILLVAQ